MTERARNADGCSLYFVLASSSWTLGNEARRLSQWPQGSTVLIERVNRPDSHETMWKPSGFSAIGRRLMTWLLSIVGLLAVVCLLFEHRSIPLLLAIRYRTQGDKCCEVPLWPLFCLLPLYSTFRRIVTTEWMDLGFHYVRAGLLSRISYIYNSVMWRWEEKAFERDKSKRTIDMFQPQRQR